MKEKRAAIWKRILAVVLTVTLLPVWGVETVKAAEIRIQVEYKQSDAVSLLGLVNNYRSNISQSASSGAIQATPLAYDYGLERVAMKRAVEVALGYEQAGPDGSTGSQAYGYGSYAESLGKQTTATSVYSDWLGSSTDRSNMSNSQFRAMGIGHIVYNGFHYWVAAYSDTPSNEQAVTLNGLQTRAVTINGAVQTTIDTGVGSALSLNAGETRNLTGIKVSAQINGKNCPLVADAASISSDRNDIVSVNGTTIKAERTGTATITITCGGQTATINVTVQQTPLTIDKISDQNYTGYAITPSITVRQGSTVLRLNTDYTVRYENNVRTGTAYVYVTGIGTYSGSNAQATFRIVTPTVANATITTIPDQAYTGNPIYPPITVYESNRMLQQGVDYDVTYYNNTNMGTATVTITGRGTYSGTKSTTFRITGQNLNTATIDAIPDQIYTGSYISPTVTVRLNNVLLIQNVDYTVSYQNNRNVGTATVRVTGKGNYSGTRTTTFRILDRDLTYATIGSISNQRYTGSEVRPEITVTLGGTKLQQYVDYTVSYQNNRQPGTATVIVTGAGSYRGSKSTTFKITQASLSSATVKASNQTYNGDEKEPNVTVRLNGELLEEGDDYEVEYRNNTKPGKATVVIYGNGYYSGTAKTTFIIKPKKQKLKSGKAQGNSAALVWTKHSNVKGYEIYRSKQKSSGYKRIGTFTTNKTTACRNTKLSRGTYYYKVRSYIVVDGKKYYGAFSNIKKVTIR